MAYSSSSSSYINIILLFLVAARWLVAAEAEPPKPRAWPLQFHSILWVNSSGSLSLIDLWYDWPNGRNFNIIQDQLGGPALYDLEWNNGTSFFYNLDDDDGDGDGDDDSSSSSSTKKKKKKKNKSCRSVQLDVGILRPNWLDGAIYLGQEKVDGFVCNVWQKVDFIWYYEDVVSKRPVHWVFYTGRSIHVMTFEVGAVLEDAKWQVPAYCFNEESKNNATADVIRRSQDYNKAVDADVGYYLESKSSFRGSLQLYM